MTIQDLNVKLGLLTQDFVKDLGKMERRMQRSARRLSSLGNDLSVAFTVPLVGTGMAALKAANDFEQFEASFAVMLGSAEKGKKLFEDIAKFTAETPFELTEVSESAKRLLAFGVAAEDVNGELQMLGDLAAGSGSNISELARIFGQSKAIGTVLTADLRELANRGIPVFDALKKRFNLTGEELRKFVEGGNVNFEILRETLQDMTKEGGIFFGGMEKQAKTLGGVFSTFSDNVTLGLASVGQEMVEVFDLKTKMVQFGEWVGTMVDRFRNLDDGTKKTIITVAAFAAALGPAIKVIAAVQGTIAQGIGMVQGLAKGFQTLGGKIIEAAAAFQKMDMASKLTTIGLVAAAIAGLVLAYQHFNEQLSLNERIQRSVQDVTLKAEQAIAAERLEAEKLTGVLTDNNSTLDERRAALQRLNQISPEYFGNLSIEKSNVEDITSAYTRYTEQLLRAARAKAAESEIIELEKERLEILKKISSTGLGFEKLSFGESLDVIFGEAESAEDYLKARVKEIEAIQNSLSQIAFDQQATEGRSQADSVTTSSSGSSAATPTKAAQEQKKALKDVASVLAELDKAYAETSVKSQLLGTEFDANAQRTALLRGAIEDLVEMGVAPTDPALLMLTERFRNLTGELGLLPQNFSVATETMAPLAETMVMQANAIGSAFTAMAEMIAEAGANAGESMLQLAEAGKTSFKALGKAALRGAADVVRAKLMEFVANVIQSTGLAAGPLAPFIAPAAGAAAGIAFNKIISSLKIPAFADGGMVTGPTLAMFGEYPGAASNPEFALRKDQLQGVIASAVGQSGGKLAGEVRWNGRDFVIGFREAEQQLRRTGGL